MLILNVTSELLLIPIIYNHCDLVLTEPDYP